MQIEKTRILLEKINNLYKSLANDPDHISSIEKDLLKDYVKALYESITDSPNVAQKPASQKAHVAKTKIVEAPPSVSETSGDQPSSSASVDETPIAATPEKKQYSPPRIIELPKETEEEIASTPPTEAQEVRHEAPVNQMDDELSILFEEEGKSTDTLSKLSNKPIADLTKAISINEKIFTVNELFGGNMIDFEQTLKSLNGCSNYDVASNTVLSEKAKEYDWIHKKRIKKAKNFIKLVRRRYL